MDVTLKKDLIYNKMKEDILSGKLKAGEKLPQGMVLAEKLGVSYITMRRAFADLAREGYIAQIHGKGTYICDRKASAAKKRFLILHGPQQDPSWPYHYIIPGIERTAMSLEIDIEICLIQSIEELDKSEIAKILAERNISGIVVIASVFLGNEKILKLLNKQNVPVVLAHALRKDYQITGWATTTYNVKAAYREALQHLLDMGHRRIMTLGEKNNRKEIRGYTYEEYPAFLKSIGADPAKELVHLSRYNDNTIPDAIRKAFLRPLPTTAIMCHSDFFAIEAYKTLKSMSLRIPEDVAVMGFCGAPDGEYMEPPLSTIDLGYFSIGKKIVELLNTADKWFFSEDAKQMAPPLIHTDYQLKIRGSTNIKIFQPENEMEYVK
ncbi:MAG: hypothetical protein A2017_06125 [Lentisphaerae bacterium GWF2_44_16]|nr:MAG: hypothetical protein A2017_06125 [Lentisphaerae bacterium GWF2_44_16]